MIDVNLLGKYEWLADFQIPNTDDKISGIMKYNQEEGITLKLLIPGKIFKSYGDTKKQLKFDILYGANVELGLFTLFNVKELGYTSNFVYTNYSCSAEILIIGSLFADKEVIFDRLIFYANDLESFCTHDTQLIEADHKALFSTQMDGAEFKIGKMWMSSGSHNSHLYFSGDKANELKKDLENLEKKYAEQKTYIGNKDKIKLYFAYDKQGSYKDYFAFLYKINSLLSLLLLRPVYTLKALFYHNDKIKTSDGKNTIDKSYQVLFSPFIHKQFCNLEKNNYFELLFHYKDFNNLEEIFTNYSKLTETKNIILKVLKNNIYRNNLSNVYERYIMLITALEAAYYQFGKKYNTKKYLDEVINLYAGERLITDIVRYLDCSKDKIGEELSSIRNYIVHYNNQNKKIKMFIESVELCNLCEALFMVLVIATYEYLGFEQKLLKSLQCNYNQIGHYWSSD